MYLKLDKYAFGRLRYLHWAQNVQSKAYCLVQSKLKSVSKIRDEMENITAPLQNYLFLPDTSVYANNIAY